MSRSVAFALAFVTGIVACSSSTTTAEGTSPAGDAGVQEAEDAGAPKEPVPFALTSSAFAEGDALPKDFACDGADVSPPLSWTAGPEGTKSYAIVFADESNGLTHAAIYDVPADVTSLPKDVEKKHEPAVPAGAKQPKSFRSTVYGWAGPCPTGKHTYVFTIYALGVDALPGTTADTTRTQVEQLIAKNDLASAKLTVTYER